MYTPEQHKFLSFAAEQMEKARKEWGAPHSYLAQVKSGSKYRMSGNARDFDDNLKNIHRDASDAFWEYLNNLHHAMASIRRDRKPCSSVDTYMPMAKHSRITRNAVGTTLDGAFPRSRFDVHIKGDSEKHSEIGVEPDGSDYWKRNNVVVSQAWSKTVYERGIPIVNSPQGLRFILSARPEDVRGVSEETRVFRVRAFGIREKSAFRHDGWLMVHGNSTQAMPVWDFTETKKKYAQNNVHAFNTDLSACRALFNRRVKQHVIDQFNI